MLQFKLDHIGYVTNDIDSFQNFWCNGLGFVGVGSSVVPPSKTMELFGIDFGAKCYRYEKNGIFIEIHIFDLWVDITDTRFTQYGLNHISLLVEDREAFLKELDDRLDGMLPVRRSRDPRGWDNIFIRDFEGNWIEIREKM